MNQQNVERNAELAADVAAELGGKTPSQALADKCAAIEKWNTTLEVGYDGYNMTLDVVANVQYDPNELSKAMVEQPMKVAWWGSLVARLARMVTHAKIELERTKADIAQQVRSGLIVTQSGKVTEGAVGEVVALHGSVLAAQEHLSAITEKYDIAKAVVEALRHRRDMVHLDGLLQNTELKSIGMAVRTP